MMGAVPRSTGGPWPAATRVITTCPGCKAKYRIDPSRLKAGRRRLKCARCTTVFPVSAPSAEAPLPVEDRASRRALQVAVVAVEPGAFRERILSALARSGARSLTTDDGTACLDAARRTRARLVVAEAYLPGLTGAEIAEAIRGEPELAATRVLLVTPGTVHPAPDTVLEEGTGVDARVAPSISQAGLEDLLAAVLTGGELPGDELDQAALDRLVSVTVSDLRAYHPSATRGWTPSRQAPDILEADVRDSRIHVAERFCRHADAARRALDEALARIGEASGA